MDIRKYQKPGKFLKATDLQGHAVTVTITNVAEETVGQGRDADRKPVLYFREEDKGLVLNNTNASLIADSYGFETTGWVGKQIELFSAQTVFNGRIVDCIRCRVPPPAAH